VKHWTRTATQLKQEEVFGAILGKKVGRNVEIASAFELRTTANKKGDIQSIDEEYFDARSQLLKETFPDLEFLGFYATGDHLSCGVQDEFVQKQAMKYNDSPLLLKFNPQHPVTGDKISLGLYRSVVDLSGGGSVAFQPVTWKTVSDLSEQIGVDHASQFSNMAGSNDQGAMKSMAGQLWAGGNFIDSVSICLDYVKAVQEQKIRPDAGILRDIYVLSEKLSVPKSEELSKLENQQIADQKLTMLLTSMANVEGSMSSLVSKMNVLNCDRYGAQMGMMRKHMRGAGIMEHFLM